MKRPDRIIRLAIAQFCYFVGGLFDPRVTIKQTWQAWRLHRRTRKTPIMPDTRYRVGKVKRR